MVSAQRLEKDAESRLIDYVEQLRHHREGRKAVMLRLSQLQPHNRDEREIEFVHKLVQPLLRNCGGEFFRLQNDDIVFVLLMGIEVSMIERVVYKLIHMFQEDRFINFGRGPGTKTFCTWFDLDSAYEDFRDAVQRQKQGVPHGPTGRTVTFEASPAKSGQRLKEPDPEAETLLLDDNAVVQNASIDTLLGQIPIRAMIEVLRVLRVSGSNAGEHVYDLIEMPQRSLEQYFLPGVDTTQNKAFAESVSLLAERRMIKSVAGVLSDSTRPPVLKFRLATLLSAEFLTFSKIWPDYGSQPLNVTVRHADAQENQRDFLYVQAFLKELGIGFGLHSVSVLDIDPDLVEAFSLLLIDVDGLKQGGESAQEVMAWLLSMKPPFPDLVLCGATGPENMARGRELGFTLFEQSSSLTRGYGNHPGR